MNSPIPWEQRPGYLMAAIGAHVQIRFAELLAPHGLQPHHFVVLRRVSTHEGSTQQALADSASIRRAAIVGLVDDLEGMGLLERRRHPEDRRANALHLTAAGRRLMTRVTADIDGLEQELLGPLNPTVRAGFLDGLREVGVLSGVAEGVYPHAPDELADKPRVLTPADIARAGRAIPARRPRTVRKA